MRREHRPRPARRVRSAPGRDRSCWPWAATSATGWPTCRRRGRRCAPSRASTAPRSRRVYETAPVGGPAQPDYLNAVLRRRDRAARPRDPGPRPGRGGGAGTGSAQQRWGPRTLDVDVIVCGDEISDDPELTLPHPRAHERAFVLAPVARRRAGRGAARAGPGRRTCSPPRAPRASGGVTTPCCELASVSAGHPVTPTRPWTLVAVVAVCALAAWLIVRDDVRHAAAAAVDRGARAARARDRRGPDRPQPAGQDAGPPRRQAARPDRGGPDGRPGQGQLAAARRRSAGSPPASWPTSRARWTRSCPGRRHRRRRPPLGAAAALIAAALYLEHCCRAPTPPDERRTTAACAGLARDER